MSLQAENCPSLQIVCAAMGQPCSGGDIGGNASYTVCNGGLQCDGDNNNYTCVTDNRTTTFPATCAFDRDCDIVSHQIPELDTACYNNNCVYLKDLAIPLDSGCRGVGEACNSDVDCANMTTCVAGKCKGLNEGMNCSATYQCAPGMYCSFSLGSTPVCKSYVATGGIANYSFQCFSTSASSANKSIDGVVCVDPVTSSFSKMNGAACDKTLNFPECMLGSWCNNVTLVCESIPYEECNATTDCKDYPNGIVRSCSCGTAGTGHCETPSAYKSYAQAYYAAEIKKKMTCQNNPSLNTAGCNVSSAFKSATDQDSWSGACTWLYDQCISQIQIVYFDNVFQETLGIDLVSATPCGVQSSKIIDYCGQLGLSSTATQIEVTISVFLGLIAFWFNH